MVVLLGDSTTTNLLSTIMIVQAVLGEAFGFMIVEGKVK